MPCSSRVSVPTPPPTVCSACSASSSPKSTSPIASPPPWYKVSASSRASVFSSSISQTPVVASSADPNWSLPASSTASPTAVQTPNTYQNALSYGQSTRVRKERTVRGAR
eukprot:1177059-Prorocentrum_minimum.AAC.1